MQLDVIIPTHNRANMLSRTLDSLLAAEVPSPLTVRVTVVDNNSKDDTRKTVESYMPRFPGHLSYAFERRQGRSFALNAGILSTAGDLIGMIDDDEEVDPSWYESIHSMFNAGDVDFIGGPYVPRWGAEPPTWLPEKWRGVIGWIDGGDKLVPFDGAYPGILMGGNAVITRAMFNRIGLYNTQLGRTGTRLLSGEDDEMYQRLLAAGARGFYVPRLIIYHYIPPQRLTKSYFRRWCFWRGVSAGVIDRSRRMAVVYFAGFPRYLYREVARGLYDAVVGVLGSGEGPARAFSGELSVWDSAGFFYGKHFYKTDAGQTDSPYSADPHRPASSVSDPDLPQTLSRRAE